MGESHSEGRRLNLSFAVHCRSLVRVLDFWISSVEVKVVIPLQGGGTVATVCCGNVSRTETNIRADCRAEIVV